MEETSDGQYLISYFVSRNEANIFGEQPYSVLQNVTLELSYRQSMYPSVLEQHPSYQLPRLSGSHQRHDGPHQRDLPPLGRSPNKYLWVE